MAQGKELIGTHWQHKITGEIYVVKEQFRVGNDIESWVDLRNEHNVCMMMQTDSLVRDYSPMTLEFQNTD